MSDKITGRPTTYSEEKATLICQLLTEGISLSKIIKRFPDMPGRRTVYNWLKANPNFRRDYAIARELLADHYFDEILEIVDDGTNDTYIDKKGEVRTDHDVVHRSKIRMEARKWVCARMAPWKYFDAPADPAGDDKKPLPQVDLKPQKKPKEPVK